MRGLFCAVLTFVMTSLVAVSCVDIEGMLLFACGNSSGHVDEYHLDDSLSAIPQSEWAIYDKVGAITTDAVLLKGDTTKGTVLSGYVVVFFNARDVCLLSGISIAKQFRSLGCDFFTLDYRGYGRSYPDFEPTESSLYEDAEAALSFLNDSLKYPDSTIILAGFSLGTGVATEMAVGHRCGALILFAAYTNMNDAVETLAGGYGVPGDWLLDARFDNLAKIAQIGIPVCLFSGRDDTFVTPEHTEELFRKAKQPKEMHLLSNQDHNRFVSESFAQWSQPLSDFIAGLD